MGIWHHIYQERQPLWNQAYLSLKSYIYPPSPPLSPPPDPGPWQTDGRTRARTVAPIVLPTGAVYPQQNLIVCIAIG